MLGITLTDWFVIVLYLCVITVIGTWAFRRVRSSASFFIGDRKFGKIMMMFFTFGTGTHSDHAVSVAAKTYNTGASGIWYQWLWLFATPFYWVIAPIYRRMRAVTIGDYFEARYGHSVSALYAIVGMTIMMVSIGVMLKGSSAIVTAVSGGSIDPNMAIFAMTVIFVVYGVAGGLSAAVVTDFVQGILTITLSFMILPSALSTVHGMSGLRELINDPVMFKIVAPEEITFFFIAIIAFNALVGQVTSPCMMGLCAAGKTEMEGRVGVTYGTFIKRICTIAWVITGLCAVGLYSGQNIDVDHVYGLMARDLLPQVAPGLVGLFIASMLASVMSSCDVFMVSSSGLFTENIYKPFLFKNRSESHYLIVGRVTSVAVVLCSILFAYSLESVVAGLEIFWKVSAMMGIAFLVGLFWRRATVAGVWTATLVSFATLLFTGKISIFGHTLWDFNVHFTSKLPAFMVWNDSLYLPWQMILYLITGLTAMITVSLFTRPVPHKKLDRFYECIRTPIGQNEPETKPFTLPAGTKPVQRRVLIQHPDFEIPVPTFISIIGFLAAWVIVGLLISVAFMIFSLGK